MEYKSSEILISKLKEFEGCKLTAYKCPAGIWTIGYGTTKDVKQGMKITLADAEKLLKKDLEKFEDYVNKLNVCQTQGQFDALVDFAYNLGTGNLCSSTLLKYIKNHKSYQEIQNQFMRWNKAGGKVLEGLTKRRKWEAARYVA